MISTSRVLLGALSATAGTAAVSVPVALKVSGKDEAGNLVNTGMSTSKVSMGKCSSSAESV